MFRFSTHATYENAIGSKVWSLIPEQVRLDRCRQRLAAAATFLRSCVVKALKRGDGALPLVALFSVIPEHNKDLIFYGHI